MKVIDVSEDSINVVLNQYLSKTRKGNRSYKRLNEYDSDTLSYSKKDILEMYESKTIYGVEPNSN